MGSGPCHYFFSQAWQVLEERVDSDQEPEQQFVWGPIYVDQLIVRNHDTNGDGALDESMYALQDASWNVSGITGLTGTAQERFIYDSYGCPRVLTPTFENRPTSSVAWNTLLSGYTFDWETHLYRVRNRMMNAVLGLWQSRDPAGYISSTNLYEYALSSPKVYSDPCGLQEAREDLRLPRGVHTTRVIPYLSDRLKRCPSGLKLDYDTAFRIYAWRAKFPDRKYTRQVISQGCVGVTSCYAGHQMRMSTESGDFQECYSTVSAAIAAKDKANRQKRCCSEGQTYLNLQPAQAIVIGFAYKLPEDVAAPSVDPETQRIDFGEDKPRRDLFDFCYYDTDLGAVWHATSGERGGGKILLDLPRRFGAGYDVVAWCVTCQSSEFSLSNR